MTQDVAAYMKSYNLDRLHTANRDLLSAMYEDENIAAENECWFDSRGARSSIFICGQQEKYVSG